MRRFRSPFLLSFLLHFCTIILLLYIPIPKKSESIEIEVVNVKDRGQIVYQPKKINDTVDNNAKFLSDHNQKVRQETLNKFIPKYNFNKVSPDANGDKKPIKNNRSPNVDYIENIDPGLETLLSTKEFVFYTYFARIKERLNPYWISSIRERFKKIQPILHHGHALKYSYIPHDMITRCLITLDNRGYLIKVQIIEGSGMVEFDEAATEAWKLASPFLNPPKGIEDSDGNIKLRWDFIIQKN